MIMSNGDHPPIERDGATLAIATTAGRLEITICTPRIVRLHLVSPEGPAGPSYLAPHTWPRADYDIRTDDDDRAVIETSAMRVEIDTRLSYLAFGDAAGNVLLRWPVADAQGGSTGDVAARFEPQGEQHFYGLGEGGAQLDRLGGARQLWNSHVGPGPGSDIGVPLLLSQRGYGLFCDNTSDAGIVVGRSDGRTQIVYRAARGELDWYYLAGGDLCGVLGQVAELL